MVSGRAAVLMEGVGSAGDTELAERLRSHDPEQFHTLVRMHLSFLLDLSTDDGESGVAEKSWLRTLRPGWLSLARKSRGAARAATGPTLTQESVRQVYQLIEFLSLEQNVCQEGIFRRSGSVLRQQELKQRLGKGEPLQLDQGHFSVHDCASVLKSFLAELPESLLTDAHYPAYCHVAGLCGVSGREPRLLLVLQLLLLLLPGENRALLRDLLLLLHLAASRPTNKMTADTLATLFTPHLLCPRKLSPEEFHASAQTMSRVVAFMIQQGSALFQIPAPLAVDIRAYWLERHKRRLSHLRDGAEASTVFSFVDRERSVESGDANPTQMALAELYAHVQALPESGHKRRLLKHFQRRQPALSSSLASCIKRHLFNRVKRRGHEVMSAVQSLSIPGSPGRELSSSDDGSGPLCGSLLRSRRSQSVVRQRRLRPRVTSLTYQEASETMMTPRSRKPVLLVSGSNICRLPEGEDSGGAGSADGENSCNDAAGMGDISTEDNAGTVEDEDGDTVDQASLEAGQRRLCCADSGGGSACSAEGSCSTCGGSLTSVFRSYLLSRSVLTASPVDLSFSSRTDDYDSSKEDVPLKEDALAESLQLYDHLTSSREVLQREDTQTKSLQLSNQYTAPREKLHETSL
ncbi:rho GTPase-activating protein 19 isoform X3 [Bacillus rossius redtenbacheri]|uniref:rho GTPase-activating protein 19 isoform X3 n=2 Tax=Bacillus rossius redtenbacheri TaxID=93214 RepID=UPI002FDECDB6